MYDSKGVFWESENGQVTFSVLGGSSYICTTPNVATDNLGQLPGKLSNIF